MHSFASIVTLALLAKAAPTSPDTTVPIPALYKRGGISYPFYSPDNIMETYTPTGTPSLVEQDDLAFGLSELASKLGLDTSDLQVTQSSKDAAGVLHVYTRQVIDSIPVDNHNAAIHVLNGEVLSFSSSFKGKVPSNRLVARSATVGLTVEEAITVAETAFDATKVFCFTIDHTIG